MKNCNHSSDWNEANLVICFDLVLFITSTKKVVRGYVFTLYNDYIYLYTRLLSL